MGTGFMTQFLFLHLDGFSGEMSYLWNFPKLFNPSTEIVSNPDKESNATLSIYTMVLMR